MPDDTDLTFRARLLRAWAWLTAHPAVAVPAGAFLLGVVVGWVLL